MNRSETQFVMDDLSTPRTAHLVGIGGTGMKNLALILAEWGWTVTGSDESLTVETSCLLAEMGIETSTRHVAANIKPACNLLIYSKAVPADNEERRAASALQITQLSYPQFLGQLSQSKETLAVAGTHGKTTTTALLGWILDRADLDAITIFGGDYLDGSQISGDSDTSRFVVEACEFTESFLALDAQSAVILNIESDHFDCYDSFQSTVRSFATFAQKLTHSGGNLIIEQSALQTIRHSGVELDSKRLETFTLDDQTDADWTVRNIELIPSGSRFDVIYRGVELGNFSLPVVGRHMIANALAAMALAMGQGSDIIAIRDAMKTFPGVKRRFELIEHAAGITVIDDYAHHPTAITATLEAARQQFPDQRLIVAFQPHQLSRTQALFNDFVKAFSAADHVVIVPIYAARENAHFDHWRVSQDLALTISAQWTRASFCSSLDHLGATLDDICLAGDVLMTLGAGDINQVAYDFSRRLLRHYAS